MPAREVLPQGSDDVRVDRSGAFALAFSQPSLYRGGFFVSGAVNRNLERITCQEVLFVR